MLRGKKILLGISGGIAAYKSPELVRQLIAEGAEVRVVATKNALEFVTPVTLQTVSKNKVYFEVFEPINNFNPEHISHSDWGDLLVVAPCHSQRYRQICGRYSRRCSFDTVSGFR